MVNYIIRRLLWVIVLLFLVSLITFVVFYIFPTSDPAQLRAGKTPNPGQLAYIRHTLGLDKPWYAQYWHYMERLVFHFDFGTSYQQSNQSVKKLIFERLPATASLTIGAAVIWLISGIGVGTISAVRRGSALDRAAMGGALVAISAPVYWLGLVALYLFSNDVGKVKIFPGANSYVPISQDPVQWFTSLLLPWFVLAASFSAIYARVLRGNLLEAMSEDYVRTARAKGLRERRVILRHGMRSAITPVVTLAGLDIGILLGGAILTEHVFQIPGVGDLAYNSVVLGDLPMIQGTVLLGAFFIVLLNLVVDILYAFIDPRVTYA